MSERNASERIHNARAVERFVAGRENSQVLLGESFGDVLDGQPLASSAAQQGHAARSLARTVSSTCDRSSGRIKFERRLKLKATTVRREYLRLNWELDLFFILLLFIFIFDFCILF